MLSNLEKFLFHMSDDEKIVNFKQELCLQISRFDLIVDVKGYFVLDGKFVAAVRQIRILLFKLHIYFTILLNWFQMIAMSATYIVIFIQFFLVWK